jgi:hypothetical protein
MSDKVKRAEFVVEAESEWGIERAFAAAYQSIEKGFAQGEYRHSKDLFSVRWNVVDTVKAEEPPSILSLSPVVPPSALAPNIHNMDIEDARGVVGTAANEEELARLEELEIIGERTPGGREGVLKYIAERLEEFRNIAGARAATEAAKVARANAAAERLVDAQAKSKGKKG